MPCPQTRPEICYNLDYRICLDKRPGHLIFRTNKENSKTHQKPSVLCTPPPFEKSPIKTHRFCVLPPLKNHPSKPIGFVYSPLGKITHQGPSVLSTPPPLEKSLFLVGTYCMWAFISAKTVLCCLNAHIYSESPLLLNTHMKNENGIEIWKWINKLLQI